MAWLTHIATGRRHVLSSSHLVGRSHACALRLHDRRVSGEHASFRWGNSGWTLRDLHSSNGTFVDQARLEPGEVTPVQAGARIAFGEESDVFALSDDSPPVAVAWPLDEDGAPLYAEEGVLCLPGTDDADYYVFEDDPGRWFVESRDGSCRRVQDGEELCSGGHAWRIELPLMWERTSRTGTPSLRIAEIGLRFRVSQNAQHVEVSIVHRGREVALQPRVHNHVLLALAEQRLRDREASELPEGDEGWMGVSELMERLKTTETMLNVDIHRARAQLRDANVLDAARLIERRRVLRVLRVGVRDIEILP